MHTSLPRALEQYQERSWYVTSQRLKQNNTKQNNQPSLWYIPFVTQMIYG